MIEETTYGGYLFIGGVWHKKIHNVKNILNFLNVSHNEKDFDYSSLDNISSKMDYDSYEKIHVRVGDKILPIFTCLSKSETINVMNQPDCKEIINQARSLI